MVFHMLVLVMALVVHRSIWLLLGDQVLAELRAALIDRDSMPYYPSTTAGSVREFAALHPRILERRDAVDGVEEPKEPNGSNRTTECFSECAHEFKKFSFLGLLACGCFLVLVIRKPTLPFLEGSANCQAVGC
jgi:hypothetical protein|tara:strand:+ start:1252 stop:1650 length:399 start_codon:yes stop_codon:yes gene_type:complete